jgi:hypothetical protein
MPGTNNGKEGDNDTSNGGLLIDSLGEFFKGKKVVVTGARDGKHFGFLPDRRIDNVWFGLYRCWYKYLIILGSL